MTLQHKAILGTICCTILTIIRNIYLILMILWYMIFIWFIDFTIGNLLYPICIYIPIYVLQNILVRATSIWFNKALKLKRYQQENHKKKE